MQIFRTLTGYVKSVWSPKLRLSRLRGKDLESAPCRLCPAKPHLTGFAPTPAVRNIRLDRLSRVGKR